MKYLDDVKVIRDKEEYLRAGVKKGAEGVIIFAWLRNDCYEVVFSDDEGRDYAEILIHCEDLEVVNSSDATDLDILDDLPKHDPKWWCKVENGYIMNLLGEKKNSVPYEYNS